MTQRLCRLQGVQVFRSPLVSDCIIQIDAIQCRSGTLGRICQVEIGDYLDERNLQPTWQFDYRVFGCCDDVEDRFPGFSRDIGRCFMFLISMRTVVDSMVVMKGTMDNFVQLQQAG